MVKQVSQVHFSKTGRELRPFLLKKEDVSAYHDLSKIGIVLDSHIVNKMAQKYSEVMDSIQPTVTTANIPNPVQFLQNWLTGFVYVATAARKIDDLIGIMISGSWEDEQIVQRVLEQTGSSVPYGDFTNIPLSSWNADYETRTVIRFEEGMQVGRLEEARNSRTGINDSAEKRESALQALEIRRNQVGFFGYNNGNNNTYGFLNDPGLPAYGTLPNGASGSPHWSTKTFLEITKDIRNMFITLQNQSQDVIDPETVDTTLALATSVYGYMSVTSDFGNSVMQWLKETYPRCRVVSAPELNAANGGANVGYLYADTVNDGSTDGGKTFIQVVAAKTVTMGVQTNAKNYIEDYVNALAGVMVKRPYAVVRESGF